MLSSDARQFLEESDVYLGSFFLVLAHGLLQLLEGIAMKHHAFGHLDQSSFLDEQARDALEKFQIAAVLGGDLGQRGRLIASLEKRLAEEGPSVRFFR